jgi:hypothetical protein
METLKELEKIIDGNGEKKGYTLRQIKKGQNSFIYEVVCNETQLIHYEVFKRVENTQFGCVSYPKSKSFGKWAWCVGTIERANEIFNQLEKLRNNE